MGPLLREILFAVGTPLAAGVIAMVAGGDSTSFRPRRRLGPRFGLSDTFDLIRAKGTVEPEPEATPEPSAGTSAERNYLDAILAQLARFESKLSSFETTDFAGTGLNSTQEAAAIAMLDRRVREQQLELDQLRETVKDAERRASTAAELLERRVRQLREDLPVLVESTLTSQVQELQAEFEENAEETRLGTVATFEAMVEDKLSDRISAIEESMKEQALLVERLRMQAELNDNQLQRLAESIERLFERGPAVPVQARALAAAPVAPRTVPRPQPQTGTRLEHAIAAANEPPAPAPPEEPMFLEPEGPIDAPDFRPRIALQQDSEGRKPRVPMARII